MTAQGWLQIAIYVVVLTALTPLLGGYMARVYTGERVFLTPILGPVERLIYRLLRANPNREQDWKAYARTVIVFSALFWVVALRDPAHPGDPAVQPGGLRLRHLGRQLQHRLVVRHQHQLAVLRRRDDALLLLADGRPGGPELRLRRGRHGRAGGRDPRLHRPQRQLARQLLAGPDPHAALHPAAALVRRRAGARLAGRDPDAGRARDLHHGRPAASRRSRSARSPRRSRSSSSAPTAAASSTSTPRSRSRTRPRSRTSSRCC